MVRLFPMITPEGYNNWPGDNDASVSLRHLRPVLAHAQNEAAIFRFSS